ncbi:MAG: transglutaminase-like domain-containing protein, partial [Rikenellaceae bacterium]
RWSHSDDNHAWVEVYTGDGWHYMGACEPEAKLDKGWFSSVATRSMLMVTKVFGDYYGSEEIISKNATFTDINLTSNYAPTKEAVIRVMSAGGKVNIPFADVEFKVFNYGQFHTIASKKSDADGLVSLTMGVGDILVWANNGEMFGFSKLAADNSDTTAIRLSLNKDRRFTYLFNMSAPSESEPKQVIISPEMEEINKQRISEGNKIRNSYINTFPDSSAIVTLAKQMNINNTKAHFIITSSRGNSSEILAFLNSVEKSKLPLAVEYLEMLPVKDLRDISAATLSDHFTNALEYENKFDKETFLNYLLNPRVLTERVTAYRTKFSKETQGRDLKEIIELVSKVEANIKFYLDGIITSPEDVLTLGISDSRSRNTLLVALCRSAGIPARIEVMSEKVQVYNTATKKWENIDYINKQSVAPDYGYLNLANSSKDVVKDPIYYTHFTLSKIKNHTNSTVNMPRNKNVDMGGGAKYSALFSKPIELEEGFYVATTGNRLENGQVYTSIESFNINSNEQTDVNLKVRTENVQANTSFSLDKFDILILLQEVESGLTKPINKILTKKDTRHHIFALIDPGTEPTNHALRGLKAIESEINAWGGDLVVAVKDKETWDAFNKNEFGKLPITTYAIDVEGHLEKFCRLNGYPKERLPCFFIINQDDEIVYVVNGYQTNLSEIIKRFLK